MAHNRPWYFRDGIVILAVLSVMALALPLVWFSPYYSVRRKVIVSVIVVIASYFTWIATEQSLKMLSAYYDALR